jgi:hypothetical protein
VMTEPIDELQRQMDAAVEALDFDTAARLRDRIAIIRGGATPEEAEAADASGLTRQQPGAMGLGSSRQRVTPPPGWKPPPAPDLMTKGRSRRGSDRSKP